LGKIVQSKQPCPDTVECKSSDALSIYEDGDGFCFSCGEFFTKDEVQGRPAVTTTKKSNFSKLPTIDEIKEFPVRGFKDRRISTDICEFFDVRVSYDQDGNIEKHYYPYGDGYNIRDVNDKTNFLRVGEFTELCGQRKFASGGKRVIVTEGEIDMLTVAKASHKKYGKIYPVVTMGSATNTKLLIPAREWLRSFDEVVIWMDQDENGEKAATEACRIIGFDKCKVVTDTEHKDANDRLVALPLSDINNINTFDVNKFYQVVFDAAIKTPAGILKRSELKERLRKLNDIVALPYPPCMEGVNSKLKGMRLGEITLFTSGTGSGKTTLIREIILHLKTQLEPGEKIGVVSLEESPEADARKLASMHLQRNCAHEELDWDTLERGFDEVFGTDEEEEQILMLDHQGSINDSSIIDKIEYMCLMGCKYILIDHITILVSEGVDKLQGNEAQDKIMNCLLSIVKRYPTWIGLISHLRKTMNGMESFEQGKLPSMDDIRGSGSIKQISFDIIAFARNMAHEDENKRNTIKMAVLKARTTGLTGPVKGAKYIKETGRLVAVDDADELASCEDGSGEMFSKQTGEVFTNIGQARPK
jgi:twinkle protein